MTHFFYPMFEQNIVEKIKEIVLPLLEEKKIELVELTFHHQGNKLLLKFLVEKSGGITLDDCVFLNQEIGNILDQNPEIISESYILEVSSPGLNRPLTTERDFLRVLGKKIKVFLNQSWEGKWEYSGWVEDIKEGKLLLKLNPEKVVQIPSNLIQKGKQIVE